MFESLLKAGISKSEGLPGSTATVSWDNTLEHIRNLVAELDSDAIKRLQNDPPLNEMERRELIREVEEELQILLNLNDPRRAQLEQWLKNRLGDKAPGAFADESTPKLSGYLQRALVELNKRKLFRLQDQYDRKFIDALFGPQAKVITFGSLCADFLAETQDRNTINSVGLKRLDKVKSAVETIIEIVGPEYAVAEIDDYPDDHDERQVSASFSQITTINDPCGLAKLIWRLSERTETRSAPSCAWQSTLRTKSIGLGADESSRNECRDWSNCSPVCNVANVS